MFPATRLRLLLIGLLVMGKPEPGLAQDKRVALVVGNSAYRHTAPLQNPAYDAADMAAALVKLGFEVIAGSDLDKAGLDARISEFSARLAGAEQGVFYYAGHGLQVSGENYLVPVDARLATSAALELEGVPLSAIQRAMEQAARFNVLFLDACRDNPLALTLAAAMGPRAGDVGRGLATATSSLGTLISYATQPGNVALDGEGRNSPFAAALLRHIPVPGRDLSAMLLAVRNDVVRATAARQIPWEHSSLWAPFYFVPGSGVEPPQAVAALGPEQLRERSLWDAVRDRRDPAALRSYLERYPSGAFAPTAMMGVARLERWSGAGGPYRPQPAPARPAMLPAIDPEWLTVRAAAASTPRCRRLYAELAAGMRQARAQCGAAPQAADR